MRTLVVTLAILVFPTALPAPAQSISKADDTAIRELVAKYVDARDNRDAKAVEALFTAGADQLVSSGEWRRGRDEVVKGTMASSQAATGKRTITVETVRMVGPGVAIADGRYEIAGSGGTAARKMWTSLTVVKAGKTWKIAAIRNMLPAPPAR